MKLLLSENIRQLRHKYGLSQEQLADKLGVSSQSVSRWETGATYPDMELLPLLAQIFGCTTDALLGIPTVTAEAKKDTYRSEIENFPEGSRERIAILKRACTEFPHDWNFTYMLCTEMMHEDSNYAEVCGIGHKALEKCTDGYWRGVFARLIVQVENDEKVFDFLERSTSHVDMRRDTLLTWRYLTRGNYAQYMAMMQKNRIFDLNTVFNTPVTDSTTPVAPDHERRIRVLRANLAYVNMVAGVDGETSLHHPIIGDGVPDMWFITRWKNGCTLVSRLSAVGRAEEALDMLEELTKLYVNFFTLPKGTVLSYRIDADGRLDAGISYTTGEKGKNAKLTFVHRIGFRPEGEEECMPIYNSIKLLEALEAGQYIDPIRKHPRYNACMEKMRGLACPE